MISAEQQRQFELHGILNTELSPILSSLSKALAHSLDQAYTKARRALRSIQTQEAKPSIREFNAFALVDRFYSFVKTNDAQPNNMELFLMSVKTDIQTWVTEFLRKAEIDTFFISIDRITGKITNDSYQIFDDGLWEMMKKNEELLKDSGKEYKRAVSDTISVERLRDWAIQGKVGDRCISISPKYTETEKFDQDEYDFVFVREIVSDSKGVISVKTTQYKTWLFSEDMRILLQQLGFQSSANAPRAYADYAQIVHPIPDAVDNHHILTLLNTLSRNPDSEKEKPIFAIDTELEKYIEISQNFLLQIVHDRLQLIGDDKHSNNLQAKIIEEALNFARRYMMAAKQSLMLGKQHPSDLTELKESFLQYVSVKHLGETVSSDEATHIMDRVNVPLGGMLGEFISKSQCYGSIFNSVGLNGAKILAPNYPFGGLGNVRPENAELLMDSMNCPFCEKKVLVWKHPGNLVQCSHCGRFKECGASEKLGDVFPKKPDVLQPPTPKKPALPSGGKSIAKDTQTNLDPPRSDPRLFLFSLFAPSYLSSM